VGRISKVLARIRSFRKLINNKKKALHDCRAFLYQHYKLVRLESN